MIYPTKEFLEIFKKTPGALSVAESIAIMNIAAMAPEGNYIEFGSYKLKSAMSSFVGLKPGKMVLLEPLFNEDYMKEHINHFFKDFKFTMPSNISLLPEYSVDYLLNPEVHKTDVLIETVFEKDNFSYVFVDSGSHQDGLPMQEAKLLEDRIIPGGIIAWHDFKNQFREPFEAAEYLVNTGKYEWIPINWQEIFDYMKENNITEEDNDSWHTYPDLPHSPNFVGAIRRL